MFLGKKSDIVGMIALDLDILVIEYRKKNCVFIPFSKKLVVGFFLLI